MAQITGASTLMISISAETLRGIFNDWLSTRWMAPVVVTEFRIHGGPQVHAADTVAEISFRETAWRLPPADDDPLTRHIAEAMDRASIAPSPIGPRDDPDMTDRITSQGG
jgi:hypothetical protein